MSEFSSPHNNCLVLGSHTSENQEISQFVRKVSHPCPMYDIAMSRRKKKKKIFWAPDTIFQNCTNDLAPLIFKSWHIAIFFANVMSINVNKVNSDLFSVWISGYYLLTSSFWEVGISVPLSPFLITQQKRSKSCQNTSFINVMMFIQ